MNSPVNVSNLTVNYGKLRAVNDITLSVHSGVTCLLGRNGAGKTSLINVLATALKPTGGTLSIAGQEVNNARQRRQARRSIGYLPQDFGAEGGDRVEDFVGYVGWLRGLSRSTRRSQTQQALAAVGLADRSRDRMRTLSGGMRQRAGIAATLVGSPRLILLDEPTVGLDPEQRVDFRRLIRSLPATSVVISTHIVEDVAPIADQVVVMSKGDVTFNGSTNEFATLAQKAPPNPETEQLTAAERSYLAALRPKA